MANLHYSDSRDIVENDPAISFDQNNNIAILIHTYFVSEPLVKKKPRVQKSGAHGLYAEISTQQLDRTDEGRTHDGQPRYSTVHDL